MGFDFIGDVHGAYKTLCALLEKLNYHKVNGVYEYADKSAPRQIIFVGDIIDRGAGVKEVLQTVHDMVEAGSAQMVMGNHELYAIAYHIEREDKPGEYVRAHTKRNYGLLEQTLDAFKDDSETWAYFRSWLLKQPVFIEHEQFRAVHACWDQKLIDEFRNRFSVSTIDDSFIKQTVLDEDGFENQFVERLLRGVELKLPVGQQVEGSDGRARAYFRTKFWVKDPQTYNDIVFSAGTLPVDIESRSLSEQERASLVNYSADEKPLFVGHYWQQGKPQPITSNIVCVDYSAVRGGQLAAYCFDGEKQLSADKFVTVDCQEFN